MGYIHLSKLKTYPSPNSKITTIFFKKKKSKVEVWSKVTALLEILKAVREDIDADGLHA